MHSSHSLRSLRSPWSVRSSRSARPGPALAALAALALAPPAAAQTASPRTAASLPDEAQLARAAPGSARAADAALDAPLAVTAAYLASRFVVLDPARNLWISPGARVHLDGIYFVGDGITADTADRRADVANTLLIRRARLELMAGALDAFTVQASGEFGTPLPFLNAQPPQSAQAPQLQTAWINYRAHPLLQFMAGQVNTPFTIDNRTSVNFVDMPERALMLRALAVPYGREIGAMVWGASADRFVDYNAGVFNGEGPARVNRDASVDVVARASVRPFMGRLAALRDAHVGASVRYGTRGAFTDYALLPMSTPGGYVFFHATRSDGMGATTLVPDGTQFAVAAELDVPVGRFGVRAEGVYVAYDTRQAEAAALTGPARRRGTIAGFGAYAQASYWLAGDARVNGFPNAGHRPPAIDPSRPPPARLPRGLQLVVRVEALDFTYDADARGRVTDPAPAPTQRFTLYGAAAALNYWATTHVRLTAHYEQFFAGALAPALLTSAPGANAAVGPRGAGGPTDTWGELTFRLAMQF